MYQKNPPKIIHQNQGGAIAYYPPQMGPQLPNEINAPQIEKEIKKESKLYQ